MLSPTRASPVRRAPASFCGTRRLTVLLLTLLLLLSLFNLAAGSCFDGGHVYEDKSSWRLTPCLTCSCNASSVLCEEEQCPAVVCDSSEDEALTFTPNRCCPVCRRRFRSCLQLDGTVTQHGSEWFRRETCEECTCSDGFPLCKKMECSTAVSCERVGLSRPLPVSSVKAGDAVSELSNCCRSCAPNAASDCTFLGRRFNAGDTWQQSECVRCTCAGSGDVRCFAKECSSAPRQCRGGRQPFVPVGSCCPVCPELVCLHNGNSYQEGQHWRSGCSECVCTDNRVQCEPIACLAAAPEGCAPGSSAWLTSDDGCCQYCAPTEGSCVYDGVRRYNGQQWNASRCGFCTCDRGKVVCQTAQCDADSTMQLGRISSCRKSENLIRDDGACCPLCKRLATCTDPRRNDVIYTEGDTWFDGLCRMCTCRSTASVDCFLSACSSNFQPFSGVFSGSRADVTIGERTVIRLSSLVSLRASSSSSSSRLPRITVLVLEGPARGSLTTSEGQRLSSGMIAEISTSGTVVGGGGGTALFYEHSAADHSSGRSPPSVDDASSSADFDYVLLHIFFGKSSANHVVSVHITAPEQPKIRAMAGNALIASSRYMTTINSSVLRYAADGCDQQSLLYYITKSPTLGDIVVAVPVPTTGILPGWEADRRSESTSGSLDTGSEENRFGDGPSRMWLPTSTFRQVDIDDGRIYYRRHAYADDRTEARMSDDLAFTVGCSDSMAGSAMHRPSTRRLEGQILSVIASSTRPTAAAAAAAATVAVVTSHISGKSTVAVDTQTPTRASIMLAFQNQTAPTTLNAQSRPAFSSTSNNARPEDLTRTSVRSSLSAQGMHRYTAAPHGVVTRFTQQDVIDQRLVYEPQQMAHGPMGKDGNALLRGAAPSMPGDATDRHRRPSYEEGEAHEELPLQAESSLAGSRYGPLANSQPPRLRQVGAVEDRAPTAAAAAAAAPTEEASAVAVTVQLMVPGGSGGSAALDRRLLDVLDDDTPPDQLSVTIKSAPKHGDLQKAADGILVYLRPDERFSYTEILGGSIKYVHDGSRQTTDTFSLKIDDGDYSVDVTVRVLLRRLPVDTPIQPPKKAALACMTITVKEGESITLTVAVVEFVSSSPGAEVTLIVASEPLHGQLRHASNGPLSLGRSMKQSEIASGLISYVADEEIGYGDVADLLYLNVSDSAGGSLPLQVLAITVQACDDKPPYCIQHVSFKVEEAGRRQLTGAHLNCHDVDTPPQDLLIVVDIEPNFGTLQTITSTDSQSTANITRRALVKSFTQEDLDRGHLYYVQSNHSRIEPRSDAFAYHVTDGTNASPKANFNITIEPTNDEPPVVVIEHLLVEEGKTVALTTSSLHVSDVDTEATSVVLAVVTVPAFGLLLRTTALDEGSGPRPMTTGESFFYKELEEGEIFYTHDGGELSTNDSFVVSVSDGKFVQGFIVPVIVAPIDDETPRLSYNNGLKIKKGTTTVITRNVLRATDIDSNDSELTFYVVNPPRLGRIMWSSAATTAAGRQTMLSSGTISPSHQGASKSVAHGGLSSFTQRHIDLGYVEYSHAESQRETMDSFVFNVVDSNNNTLRSQTFYIEIASDTSFPEIVRNNRLVVKEKSTVKLTTDHLYVVDADADSEEILFEILERPRLGQVTAIGKSGVTITDFTLADLSAGKIAYAHTSKDETTLMDNIIFSVSDGSNSVMLNFNIEVLPVDDSLPLITVSPLTIHEGAKKIISEFEIKALDNDTRDDRITFTVVREPAHGKLELLASSARDVATATAKVLTSASNFSMADVYAAKLRYNHDGSESMSDVFSLTVTDGTNDRFVFADGNESRVMPAGSLMEVRIDVIPVDDRVPLLLQNSGIHSLLATNGKVSCIITSEQLKAVDNDTTTDKLLFKVTQAPQFGRLEKINNLQDGLAVSQFSQADVDDGVLSYVLTAPLRRGLTADTFKFDVTDTRPNIVRGNTFHITWSTVSFEKDAMHVRETDGFVRLPILREGNLKEPAIVSCRPLFDRTSAAAAQQRDSTELDSVGTVQVQFPSWQPKKTCDIAIPDDSIHEGSKAFIVELLQSSVNVLVVSPTQMTVVVDDGEDQPVLQFAAKNVEVNETEGLAKIQITRTGDSSSAVWVMCITRPLSASGSHGPHYRTGVDYESREEGNARRPATVHLDEGATSASCDVKIIDDAVYEEVEDFEVLLVHPSYNARLGASTSAIVRILGPNDVSIISMQSDSISVAENAGQTAIQVVRDGPDLSMTSSVWCSTKLSSVSPMAEPSRDYVPSSARVVFEPEQRTATCAISILDDDNDGDGPRMEGAESFMVVLSATSGGAVLGSISETRVTIDDTALDAPRVYFDPESYHQLENNRTLYVTVRRTGDLSAASSVICYTRQRTALAGEDYEERPLLNSSRIQFAPGQNTQLCTVHLIDDEHFESEEEFAVRLAQPLLLAEPPVAAALGKAETATVIVVDPEDVTAVQFERPAYSVAEPTRQSRVDTQWAATAELSVRLVRSGDPRPRTTVRCSTRDGSATSGVDYRASSLLVAFEAGVRHVDVTVTVLENVEARWHRSFALVLESPAGATFGNVTSAIVTVVDNGDRAVAIMPAPPLVISLLHYRQGAQDAYRDSPSAGHPLLCLDACDPLHPAYLPSSAVCRHLAANRTTSAVYRWEVAESSPFGAEPGARDSLPSSSLPQFFVLSDPSPFGSARRRVLESFYFRPGFRVRCTAQPIQEGGQLGVPLRSLPVLVTGARPVCQNFVALTAPPASTASSVQQDGGGRAGGLPLPLPASAAALPHAFVAQTFVVSLRHVPAGDAEHANTMHIRVIVPHEDGMLPLVSTLPLRDVRALMASTAYRQQHPCSNFARPLASALPLVPPSLSRMTAAAAADAARDPAAVNLYSRLDVSKCTWTFDAWYGLSELVDVCGGSASSAYDDDDERGGTAGRHQLIVRLPLHVAYVFAAGAAGWTSLEQHTEATVSFRYDAALLNDGGVHLGGADDSSSSDDEASPIGGQLQVTRLSVDADGRLVADFRTVANFRGLYLMHHDTSPDVRSRVRPPASVSTSFELQLLSTQPTYDNPVQTWRIRSAYSLQDYSGSYEVDLLPCRVQPKQPYVPPRARVACSARQPMRFTVSISFRQAFRPVPVRYRLDTELQIRHSVAEFLADPRSASDDQDMDVVTTFSRGQLMYGRAFWDPRKDLGTAYRLSIQKVYVCAGNNGYVPIYDPSGEVYGQGPQLGCLQPSRKLRHRFLVLDSEEILEEQLTGASGRVDFQAVFARDSDELSALQRIYHGSDGFRMSIDSLCEIAGEYQWYVQVLYVIEPAASSLGNRSGRSARAALPRTSSTSGTSMAAIKIRRADAVEADHRQEAAAIEPDGGGGSSRSLDGRTDVESSTSDQLPFGPSWAVTSAVVVAAVVCASIALLVVFRQRLPRCAAAADGRLSKAAETTDGSGKRPPLPSGCDQAREGASPPSPSAALLTAVDARIG